jgi:hypothetical protein
MSHPIEVPLSPEQVEMYRELNGEARRTQEAVSIFCAAILRGKGIVSAVNIQLVGTTLVGEVPDPPKVEP